MERLENGFNLFTNGAHQSKEKFTPRYTTATKSSLNSKKSQHFTPRKNSKSSLLLRYNEEKQEQERFHSTETTHNDRKRWENASFCIKTTDGCQIKINAPNRYEKNLVSTFKGKETNEPTNPYYSYDFESESEDEFKNGDISDKKLDNKKTSNKNLIESVLFSDCSDNEEKYSLHNPKKKKNFVLQLTMNDVQVNYIY